MEYRPQRLLPYLGHEFRVEGREATSNASPAVAKPGSSWMSADEDAGFVDQLGPSVLVAVVEQDPFVEGAS